MAMRIEKIEAARELQEIELEALLWGWEGDDASLVASLIDVDAHAAASVVDIWLLRAWVTATIDRRAEILKQLQLHKIECLRLPCL